jgi:hypothetical protein
MKSKKLEYGSKGVMGEDGVVQWLSDAPATGDRLALPNGGRVEKREIFRPFPVFSTIFRTDQARNSAMLASQARHKLDAPSGLFACAKRGRAFPGGTNFS